MSMCGVVVGAMLLLSPLRSAAGVQHGTLVIIANKSVSATRISRDELRPIFQTKKDTWPDGSSARPFNLPEGTAARRSFDAAVLGLDPDRVARYWIDRKIRGGERPPQTSTSSALMLKIVSKTSGALGYVEAADVDASVKVIARVVDGQVVAP
jgi:ABC-type phosphate transport system substrate-binding protein